MLIAAFKLMNNPDSPLNTAAHVFIPGRCQSRIRCLMHGSEDDRTYLSDGLGQAIDRGKYLCVYQRALTDDYRRFDALVVFAEEAGKPFEKRARLVIQ